MIPYCPGAHELSVRPWSEIIFCQTCKQTLNYFRQFFFHFFLYNRKRPNLS
ncbi:unnamed protein product [Staurois parvus]|uniref:Uncharacterized protein n=1 Tax=Staurois parvus TaxID=386267 RepID=A0ABN9EKA5_9NEOB|nr:unnamed protein product [Staurois parvus]